MWTKIFLIEVEKECWDEANKAVVIAENRYNAKEVLINYDDYFEDNIKSIKEINMNLENILMIEVI